MNLLKLQNISMGYGGPRLLDSVNLQVEPGERICLLGRNGQGKSTLLRIMTGTVQPDQGTVYHRPGARRACLEQEVPSGINGSVFDVVAGGCGAAAATLTEFYQTSLLLSKRQDPELFQKLERLQQVLEETDGWKMEQKVGQVLTRLKLDPERTFEKLSAGVKRRVMLARALVSAPDLLLLDEPTNHLDIHAIEYLEEYLGRFPGTVLFVTHDRRFLRNLATRILELDRGRLLQWKCDYQTYLQRKEADLAAEERTNIEFDKKLAREEHWIRQGIKARRTRNEGRVRALERMREIRKQRRRQIGSAKLIAQEAEKSGKLVVEVEQVSYQWEGNEIIRDFSTTILRGDKVGIIGPNGAGKTTLLKILLGELPPDRGRVRTGVRLQAAYFDQLRAALDEDKSVQDNVSHGNDMLTINGKPRHVISYLQDFLFTPDRARSPVRTLSGGERNRLLLASIFSRASNVLVLDEPTNDLDLETLELLEERVLDYAGTVLLISHDRAFLNHVVTSTLVFEGQGRVNEYVGGYDDWIAQRPEPGKPEKVAPNAHRAAEPPKKKSRKLSYHEQRELMELPNRIEALEEKQQEYYRILSDPGLYQRQGSDIAKIKTNAIQTDQALEAAYLRWEQLESRK